MIEVDAMSVHWNRERNFSHGVLDHSLPVEIRILGGCEIGAEVRRLEVMLLVDEPLGEKILAQHLKLRIKIEAINDPAGDPLTKLAPNRHEASGYPSGPRVDHSTEEVA